MPKPEGPKLAMGFQRPRMNAKGVPSFSPGLCDRAPRELQPSASMLKGLRRFRIPGSPNLWLNFQNAWPFVIRISGFIRHFVIPSFVIN